MNGKSTPGKIYPNTFLSDPHAAMQVIGILVKRLGGRVEFTQADFDETAYALVYEEHMPPVMALVYKERPAN